MAGSTSVPSPSFTTNGYVPPTQEAIVAGLNADFTACFGSAAGPLNTSSQTPQGQLIASIAAMVGDCYDQFCYLANSIDPYYAAGRYQDGIGRIYFMTRFAAQPTALEINCTGLVGVIIPVGATIQDSSGNLYSCSGQVTIPSTGSVIATFQANNTGPTPVPAANQVSIYQSIPGFNTVAVSSGIQGTNVEGRVPFEVRRELTVAANANAIVDSIQGAVLQVPDVLACYVYDNFQGTSQTVGGVLLLANSLYVCVEGGASAAIGQAIFTKKPPGCNMTGNTSVTVFDTTYPAPQPSYAISYEIPTGAPICFAVTIQNNPNVPSTALTQIQAAILQSFNGLDNFGTPQASIGSIIVGDDYVQNIRALGSWARVYAIGIGNDLVPTVTFTGAIVAGSAGTSTLTVSSVTGTIAIGQFVFGTNVAPGTIITAMTSSTVWTVSGAQTVLSEAMTSVTANNRTETMNINWLPTLNDLNISLTLM